MAWQQRVARGPARESEEGSGLPELSGLGRRSKGGGREVAVTVPGTMTPVSHWQGPRMASGAFQRGSLPSAL